MQVKKIINLLKEHKSSKSKSFYLKNPYQKINKDFKTFLLNYSKDNKNCDLRICIHENSNRLLPKSKITLIQSFDQFIKLISN